MQLAHKNITNPTILHANKVMTAIINCAKTIKGMSGHIGAEQMQQLLQLIEAAIQQHPRTNARSSRPTLVQTEPSEDYLE